MIVEILSGPLIGSSYCDYQTFDKDWGFFILAIDPQILTERDEFIENTTNMTDLIRANGGIVPGDSGRAHEKNVLESGFIEIEDKIAELLRLV